VDEAGARGGLSPFADRTVDDGSIECNRDTFVEAEAEAVALNARAANRPDLVTPRHRPPAGSAAPVVMRIARWPR
jgi:hypothetical protein